MKSQESFIMLFLCFLSLNLLYAQSAQDYRSVQSGNWDQYETWEVYTGTGWTVPASPPNDVVANQISIRTGHSVTANLNITIDQTVVEAGAELVMGYDKIITVNDGAADDLVVNGTLSLNGNSNQYSVGITGNGKVVIAGLCNWFSGGITNTDFWIAPSGILHLQGSLHKIMRSGAVIHNQGTILHQQDSGSFMGVGNSVLNNLAGGLYHAMGSGTIRYEYAYDWNYKYTFNNYGNILKSMPETSYTIYRGTFNNFGTVEIMDGSLQISGSGTYTSSGAIEFAVNTVLRISNAASLSLNEGAEFSGSGTLWLDQSNTNTVLSVNSSPSGIALAEDTMLKINNGTIGGSGQLLINGEMQWQGGRCSVAQLTLGPAAMLRIQSGLEKRLINSTVDNYGQILIEDDEIWHSNNGSVINLHVGSLLDFQANGSLLFRSDLGGTRTVLNNYGSIIKSGGTGSSTINRITFNNHADALCHVQSGTLQLWDYGAGTNSGSVLVDEDCTFSVRNNFEWTLAEGSSIAGMGTLLLNGGKIYSSATVSGASLGAELQFDMLSGYLAGSGTLNLLGDMLWSGGHIACGNLIVSASSTVLGTGATDDLRTSGTGFITNYGHICITGSVGSSNITYLNQAGAILEFGLGGGVWHTGGGAGNSILTNHGTLSKSGESQSTLIKVNTTNQGTVEVSEGTLQFEQSQFHNNAQVNVMGGFLRIAGSSSGSGSGNYFLAEDAIFELASSCSITCQEAAVFEGFGEIRLVSGGTLNTSGSTNGLSIAPGIAITQTGGNLGGGGKLFYAGTHTWTEGNCQVGNYYLGADGLIIISGTDTKRLSNGSFHNYGIVRMSGSLGAGSLNFYNYQGAELQAQGSFDLWHTGGGSVYPSLYNHGTVRKSELSPKCWCKFQLIVSQVI